nr:hypothetical protein Iba_scaffold16866CG0040 [Ipomoea batatas]GME20756.1 hypothetical protein Iba_scaffold26016CG0010 [Ipomoea batatas]
MYPRLLGSSSSIIMAAYSSACFWIFDSLFAEALRLMICTTSSSFMKPSASLSTLSKKVWRRESKLWSAIWSQNSWSCCLLMESEVMFLLRARASNNSPAKSLELFIPEHI